MPFMRKGWFKIPGVQDGDRQLDEQMKGLAPALIEARGKTVLDLGTAEGLIAAEFARAGACGVLGIEVIAEHVQVAKRHCNGLACEFRCGNLNDPAALPSAVSYDIVLLLAILHKLREPAAVLERIAKLARALIVVRYPIGAQHGIIIDSRSNFVPCNVPAILKQQGFEFEREEPGPRKERVQYWRRAF